MKKTFVQFACDADVVDFLKFIAVRRRMSLTALCQEVIFDYLANYEESKVKENQAASPQKEGA